ncbi:MAG: winged helix DNA-binding domain-containing protein [Spirochaetes bacterium]|nr:winged helix DNA-binding domain-containing protein [Spirochaetota bacterium]MBU1079392.1 winged helix DNA-binding domain-containing protein [Spirochaetota bacterium]
MSSAVAVGALSLSREEAIGIAYRARFPSPGPGGEAADTAYGTLERLGYVQIDTISVVERAHHHVLWSGDGRYRPPCLPALEAEPRRAFEYWAHAAAYLPIGDYRYCLPRMKRVAETGHDWFPTEPRVVQGVLERIRSEGPLRSADFAGGDGPRGPWWDWKPAKAALEFLFMSGTLLVASRPGFQKLYDLAERVLPPGIDARFPSDEEMGDWYVDRASRAYGIFAEADVAYLRKDGLAGIGAALERAVDSGRLVRVGVEGDEKRAQWAAPAALEAAAPGEAPGGGLGPDGRPVRILSPFDNYVIDRKRARRLIGLDYTLECYVPAAKRKFGYFALPVIWKGKPAGLLDCSADRKTRTLVVKRSSAAAGPDERDEFDSGLAAELASFASFNGCDSIRFA